jgi:hypothetical protein
MRIQEAKIDPVIGSGSEDLTTSSSGEATLSIRLKLSYLVEDCNLSPAGAVIGRNPTPQGLSRPNSMVLLKLGGRNVPQSAKTADPPRAGSVSLK